MAVQLLVGNRLGRIIGELRVTFAEVAWRLNTIGRMVFVISKNDDKATEDYLRYGNRVLLRFSSDLGLPNWGGLIDPPRGWNEDSIRVTCYGIEWLLQYRRTGMTKNFYGVPVGNIFFDVINQANFEESLGVTFGHVWMGGSPHFPRYHAKNLWWIVTKSLIAMENCDVRFQGYKSGGEILFRAEMYQRLGDARNGAFKQGKNVAGAEFVEQGPIINEVLEIGAGTTWGPERPSSRAINEDSRATYGLRQKATIHGGVTVPATLDRHANTHIEEWSESRTNLALSVVNKDPAPFSLYREGDVVRCVLPDYGFLGYDQNVRVLARDYSTQDERCALVVQEDKDPTVVPLGPAQREEEQL